MQTQEPGVRIIDKTGPLDNYADRDHCLQYMVAIGLIFGELTAHHYTDATAKDPRIDALRSKMVVSENTMFTEEYYDLEKRAIGNSIQVHFKDGTSTDQVEVSYPIGHRVRRDEGIPVLKEKFSNSLPGVFDNDQIKEIHEAFADADKLGEMTASEFMTLFMVDDKGMMLA